jgi:hypothetical protein
LITPICELRSCESDHQDQSREGPFHLIPAPDFEVRVAPASVTVALVSLSCHITFSRRFLENVLTQKEAIGTIDHGRDSLVVSERIRPREK